MHLCECGCGQEVTKEGNRFIHGHHSRVIYCGDKISKSTKGKKKSEEHKMNLSISKKGKKLPHTKEWNERIGNALRNKPKSREHIENMSKSLKGKKSWCEGLTKDTHEGLRKIAEVQKERCLNGHSKYMNSLVSNPSKPQKKIFESINNILKAELEFPVITTNANVYRIDIAIPEKKIAIEYDCSYWHNEEKDMVRQAELENEGWKFIRYKDFVPSKEQVLEAIEAVERGYQFTK